MSLTTLSQLGCRRSLAELHVLALLNHTSNVKGINHVFYNVSDENIVLKNFVKNLGMNHQVFFQSDNNYTPFGRKLSPKYGGDHNYDFLIRSASLNERFLTLHDDSIFKDGFLTELQDEMIKNEVDFFGFKDTRVLEPYTTVFLDNLPFSDLRIGTWFFSGLRDVYLGRGYTMAEYQYYYRWLINFKYRTTRISSSKIRIWLNGGFDVNLKGRLDRYKFTVLDVKDFPDSIVHNEKNTGFFSKRDMLERILC
jgi:hypothetical protein